MRDALSWLVAIGLLLLPGDVMAAAGCPGTIRFDNGAGTGLWQTAQNWDTDVLPGAADDVCIPAGMNVTLGSGTQTINTVFVESGATLTVSGGTLSIAAASQVDGGLTLSGGILTGAGDVTTHGSFVWTGGQMTGTGTTHADVGIVFSGASVKDINTGGSSRRPGRRPGRAGRSGRGRAP